MFMVRYSEVKELSLQHNRDKLGSISEEVNSIKNLNTYNKHMILPRNIMANIQLKEIEPILA